MRKFSIGIIIRVSIIVLMSVLCSFIMAEGNLGLVGLIFLSILLASFNLYYYATSLNKKLSRIFDSIQYQDFAITFRADNAKGATFEELNNSLNSVIRSFNQVRAEREATLHFIQAIIQHINVGILAYNADGKIEVINQAANKLLSIYKISHISAIKTYHSEIYELMISMASGESKLLKINNNEFSLSIKEIILRDRKIKLVALHNIRSELQARELEAWQNLTKVLRHEIMNTVTPIVSLSETMRDIIEVDLSAIKDEDQQSSIIDLKRAISTVINRSKGIMNFVNAYREFTNIPLPNLKEVLMSDLLKNVSSLYGNAGGDAINFDIRNDFLILCDPDQIEQVLINLLKNAREATEGINLPVISVITYLKNQYKTIEISDNGSGISANQVEKIFVPFYTTKTAGTGIGLSLSRQIMQMHGGTLEHIEDKQPGSRFLLVFP